MSKADDQFILDAWQTLTENLLEVNKTLSELVSELVKEQHQQILKLSPSQSEKDKE